MSRKSPQTKRRPSRPKIKKLRIIYGDDPEFETLFRAGKVAVGGPLQPAAGDPGPNGERWLNESEIMMAIEEENERLSRDACSSPPSLQGTRSKDR